MNPKRRRRKTTFPRPHPFYGKLIEQLGRIAVSLERLADRIDADAKVFNEMVEKGKNLSA